MQRRLASLPPITMPSVTLDGDADGVLPTSDNRASAAKFTGRRIHQVISERRDITCGKRRSIRRRSDGVDRNVVDRPTPTR
jgi:hypothetical protein